MKVFVDMYTLYACNGTEVDRTYSAPKSVLRLEVDKGQELRSGILTCILDKPRAYIGRAYFSNIFYTPNITNLGYSNFGLILSS